MQGNKKQKNQVWGFWVGSCARMNKPVYVAKIMHTWVSAQKPQQHSKQSKTSKH